MLELASRVTGRELHTVAFPKLLLALGAATGSWLLYGAAFELLVDGLIGVHSIGYFDALGYFAASYILGFVAVFVPGGLGVREFTMVSLLTPLLGGGHALVVAVASRLLFTATEITAVAVVFPVAGALKTTNDADGPASAGPNHSNKPIS
jgi:uncharacterized membrane protein YbhN (UPF0104 family)